MVNLIVCRQTFVYKLLNAIIINWPNLNTHAFNVRIESENGPMGQIDTSAVEAH